LFYHDFLYTKKNHQPISSDVIYKFKIIQ